ncbi:MAG: holo-[acyl-carrier-protein] synthase [Paenibacillus sp. RIFOXYA1_FULL_44_5]|nr:MAG: holo-[acyl-carrier-protein] synthase [Paenibacillus sp. RIFOXYA1_FULL_44_5]
MIIGLGMDIVEIARVARILHTSSGARFLARILTAKEQELAGKREPRLAEHAAGRFAAKEAVVKALGCGIGEKVGFQDIEILPNTEGKPQCMLSPAAMQRLGYLSGEFRIHVTITHSERTAAATAIVEQLQ